MTNSHLLELHNVDSGYGRTQVLRDVSLHVDAGELVALIGSNGAGKSTLLKTIVGLLRASSGELNLDGNSITHMTPEKLVRRGVALVPEGRLLFGPMTVRENLELGAYSAGARRGTAVKDGLRRVFELFPVLSERASQHAETLSGGEQQMLAVARALMSSPTLLLLDEPSLGLAPRVIAEIFSALEVLRREGMTILLVEQDARLALKHADRGYVMRTGEIVLEGAASDLLTDESVRTIYLGLLKGEGSA
ncbi:MAG: ABC transporter ATP-binding protein [Actinobacteria bacterium HGW-Actinobacteria-7]|jgi:branched-chain amino acid transport system ATP-binding protein|nr:MAG: ABC transporter ATP-binding protein [Actinobacteria bacterium HGW-Actinobacteria-7]